MKKNIIASVIMGFCLLFVMQTALADKVPMSKEGMNMSGAVQKLYAKGYKNIRSVEFKDGFYKAEVVTLEGDKLELKLNTKTGQIENSETEKKSMGMLEIIKKVQAEGYHDISKIDFDDGKYEVSALDKDNKDVKVKVKASTGEIKKDWF